MFQKIFLIFIVVLSFVFTSPLRAQDGFTTSAGSALAKWFYDDAVNLAKAHHLMESTLFLSYTCLLERGNKYLDKMRLDNEEAIVTKIKNIEKGIAVTKTNKFCGLYLKLLEDVKKTGGDYKGLYEVFCGKNK